MPPTNPKPNQPAQPIAQNNLPPTNANVENNTKKDDDYANALATMATIDYQMRERSQPETKHFISKKMLVSIIISLVLSIITLIVGKFMTRNDSQAKDNQTINELLQTTKEIKDIENQ